MSELFDLNFPKYIFSTNRTLSHPNLVKLIGVVKHLSNGQEKNEISLVTEYMPKGSLLDYLMSRGRNVLTKKELIEFVMFVIEICVK